MKILWILNIIMPYPAEYFCLKQVPFGGWLVGMLDEIKNKKNTQLAIVSFYSGNKLLKCNESNIIYYLIPCKNGCNSINLKSYYFDIVKEFKPQLVHIHGTEFSYGLSFLKNFSDIKSVISLQGIMTEISKKYLAGISKKDVLANLTFRDIIKKDSILQAQKKFFLRASQEREVLSITDNVIGRTNWDYEFCKSNFPKLIYYKCNENLRECFYSDIWSIKKIERHSIMFGQATYPIKGFHCLLKALSIVKSEYSDLKVYVTGQNILDTSTFIKKIKLSGYGKYLKKLIKKYDLTSNIVFCGMCDSREIKRILLKSNVFVQSSIIENSSNALCEAMILGVPCIVSNVGGTSSIINNKEGLIYEYNDTDALAEKIKLIFDDDIISQKLSKNARVKALLTHNKDKNYNTLIKIYHEIINKGANNEN